MDVYGFLRVYGFYGYLWEFMGFWVSISAYGYLWVFMAFYGFLWVSGCLFMGVMGVFESLSMFMSIYECL